MTRKLLGLPIPVLFAIGCLVSSSSAHAQKSATPERVAGEKHFQFNTGRGECLVANKDEFVVSACSPLPESTIEVVDGFVTGDQAHSFLRIKVTPQNFLVLTGTLPNPVVSPPRLPQKVMPNQIPNTLWRISGADDKGFRFVLALFEAQGVSFCLVRRERPGSIADVVLVDGCGDNKWKLVPVPAPFPPS